MMSRSYPFPDQSKSAKERAYASSIIAFSQRGLRAAQREYYDAERRRIMYYPPGKGPADDPPLQRSKIKSPLESAKMAEARASASASTNGPGNAMNPSASVGLPPQAGTDAPSIGNHPRHAGRNGTPMPTGAQAFELSSISSPSPTSSTSPSSSSSAYASASPSDSNLFTSTSTNSSSSSPSSRYPSPTNSRANSASSTTSHKDPSPSLKSEDQVGEAPKCADATFSLGLSRPDK